VPPEDVVTVPNCDGCEELNVSAPAVAEDDLAEDYIIPSVFNREVAPAVAEAVVEEAKRDGIARFNPETGTFAIVDV